MMKPKEIQKLIELVEKSNITELEVSRWWKKVRIRKQADNHRLGTGIQENIIVSSHPATPLSGSASAAPSISEKSQEMPSIAVAESKFIEVRSPMVGTFYRAPAPDAAPYVEVGAVVSKGQVLCIIEAMKLMNEIEAELPGRIAEILVENAKPVEYNQLLFKMEKV